MASSFLGPDPTITENNMLRGKIARRAGLLVGLPATLLLAFPIPAIAAEYGEIAQGNDYTACQSSEGNCKELFNTTERGKYWCKAWANESPAVDDDLLRFRCRVEDTNADGHGVYIAIKNFDLFSQGHWEMGSGVVGPEGKVEHWHSVGTWNHPGGDSRWWRFHLCWYIPGEHDPCAGYTDIEIPGTG